MSNLQAEKEAVVINLFLTSKNNTVPAIVAVTGLAKSTVNQIINKYLSNLKVNHEEVSGS